jgi:hypothetical protein
MQNALVITVADKNIKRLSCTMELRIPSEVFVNFKIELDSQQCSRNRLHICLKLESRELVYVGLNRFT